MSLNVQHLRGGTYYFPLKYSNAGLYMFKKHCVLIDAGALEEEGKAIVDYLVSKGLKLETLIVTHAHADNAAGAAYIKSKTKASVYSTKEESLVLENPQRSLYSAIITEIREEEVTAVDLEEIKRKKADSPGSNDIIRFIPTKKKVPHHTVLAHKKCLVDGFLVPGKSFVTPTFKHKFGIIALPGHSVGQIGVVTPDSVFFIADSLYTSADLETNPIPYTIDAAKTEKTLDYLLKSKYTLFVPTHGKPLDFSITAEVYNNLRQIKMLEDTIMLHLSMPKTTDELVALVLSSFDLENNVPNFYLLSSTISSYLEKLKLTKKNLKVIHEKGKTRWFADL